MTFDEIFQQYIAQGFTKPISGVSGIETLTPATIPIAPIPVIEPRGGENDINTNTIDTTNNAGINTIGETGSMPFGLQTNDFVNTKNLGLMALGFNPLSLAFGTIAGTGIGQLIDNYQNPYTNIMGNLNQQTQDAIGSDQAATSAGTHGGYGSGTGGVDASGPGSGGGYNEGNFCFDPKTPIQMADGSTKEIKNIQLGDDTKGGEVTGVFQFKASDEIHNYKGVTVAGSHFVKEDGKFIMVKDSPLAVKIDKIPVVYSLDTTGRRIFINDIEFADYNGDGVAKNFLTNAGVDLTGFDTEVLRQVENRLI